MPYNVWDSINQGQSNLMNALAMRKQQEQADARNAILAQKAQMDMRIKADEFNRTRQMDQMKIEDAQRAQQVQQVKGAYNILNSINSQADLDRARGFMQQNAPEYLNQVPEVYDDKGKSAIDGYKNLYRNVAVDQFKMTERWVKDANGNRYPVLLDRNENPADMQLPEGYNWVNQDLEKEDIKNQGAMARQQAGDQAAMSREQAGNQSAMDIAKLNSRTEIEKQKMQEHEKELTRIASQGRDKRDTEIKMAEKFQNRPDVKSYLVINQQYDNMKAAVDEAKKQGGETWAQHGYADRAILITLNKMLEPNSAVLSSEFAATLEGQSYRSQLENIQNKMTKGGYLIPEEREAVFRMATAFRDNAKTRYDAQVANVDKIASRYGLDTRNITSFGDTTSPPMMPDDLQSSHDTPSAQPQTDKKTQPTNNNKVNGFLDKYGWR